MNQGAYFILKNTHHQANAVMFISKLEVEQGKPWSVKVEEYSETRRNAQNGLARMWAGEVAKQGQEHTANHVHQLGKYHFGVPILLAEDERFREFWYRVEPLFIGNESQSPYEDKLENLMPMTPVTSRMSVKQMHQYLTDFQRVQGQKYQLTDPSLFNLEIK